MGKVFSVTGICPFHLISFFFFFSFLFCKFFLSLCYILSGVEVILSNGEKFHCKLDNHKKCFLTLKGHLPSPISFNQPPLELSPCALMATIGFGNRGSPISFSFLSFSLLDLHRFIIHSFSSPLLSLSSHHVVYRFNYWWQVSTSRRSLVARDGLAYLWWVLMGFHCGLYDVCGVA